MIFEPNTESLVTKYKRNLPQGLLLSGESGVGLGTTARWLAEGKEHMIIRPTVKVSGNLIATETIRNLYESTRGKRSGELVVVLDDADTMSRSAQTAFLKLLEEPPTGTRFILTSHKVDALLPTIRSRLQHCVIQPVDTSETEKLLDELNVIDKIERAKLLFIANGLPAEIHRNVHDAEYFAMRSKIMSDARSILQSKPYDNLLLISAYSNDRAKTTALVDAMLMILRRTLGVKPDTRLVKRMTELLALQNAIAVNANLKLQLTQAML